MTELIKIFFPRFQAASTVENAGSKTLLVSNIKDPKAYDAKIQAILKHGAERRAKAEGR